MSCSVIFACGFKYSELWLQTHLELFNFCVSEHTKVGTLVSFNWIVVFQFFMGSCGQWFLQNMAHATIYAACGKVLFIASFLRYLAGIREFSVIVSWKKENEA